MTGCSRNRRPDRKANGAEHERLSFKQIKQYDESSNKKKTKTKKKQKKKKQKA